MSCCGQKRNALKPSSHMAPNTSARSGSVAPAGRVQAARSTGLPSAAMLSYLARKARAQQR